MGVGVGVEVGVLVGVGVNVLVGVDVLVGVLVGVRVGVLVGVLVGVGVTVGVAVFVGVLVGVAVGMSNLARKTTNADRNEPKSVCVSILTGRLFGQGMTGYSLYLGGYSTSSIASSPGRKFTFLEKLRYPRREVVFCSRLPSGLKNVTRAFGRGKSGPLL